MMKFLTSILFSLTALVTAIGPTYAASGPWQGGAEMQARLISAIDSLDGRDEITAGLEVKLAKGWKIYWRSPGDAGLPPELDFSKTPSVIGHHLDFPAPKRFSILGFDSFGYADHVIYPLRLSIAPQSQGITIAAQFDGLVCKDVCIPVREILTLSLPKGQAAASEFARDIAQYMANVPRQSTAGGIALKAVYRDGDDLVLPFQHPDNQPIAAPEDIMIEAATGYAFAQPQWQDNTARIAISGKPAEDLSGENITVTVVAKGWLLEAPAMVKPASAAMASSDAASDGASISTGLFAMMVIAFLGGLILNVMPCVLPVISLKLGSVMGMGHQPLGQVRVSFLMTAAGVITSFMLLGVGLLALRQAGVAIGWGIQFQNPIFLGFAASAIALFGLVMLDIINLPVPQFIQNLGRGMRQGQNGPSYAGDFLSGALATLLATPCSAPFVGTAIAFALTATPHQMMVIFLAMGIGLAMPWLVIAAAPRLAVLLPKPGAWFKTLKQILAAGLFLTSAWLISILVTVTVGASSAEDGWRQWQPQLAEELARDGQVVFVDVTADWCITCKANKALVLNTDEMKAVFADKNVVLLQADWTAPNDEITAYLASFDRYGIPFNIVYGPSQPEGVILPELLTREAVLGALNKASDEGPDNAK